jgi:hypothetical protein
MQKNRDEKACIKVGRIEFENAWLSNPNTNAQPMVFPPHFKEIDVMFKWVRDSM